MSGRKSSLRGSSAKSFQHQLITLAGSKAYRSSLRRRLNDWRILRSKKKRNSVAFDSNIRGMWSNVQVADGCPAPSSRSKHAMCVSQAGFIYLLGGRSANLPLKDLWKFDPVYFRDISRLCMGFELGIFFSTPSCDTKVDSHLLVY
ncbi:uncharacterized protein LOC118201399 [Stegodyphus dumicola]|uniref:uncharacterized protein LOC118201399 n=1 Tax=Stegodyphus dumicola TaxID=202533 RepID=UPI0015AD0439|nr:uncharacterized protein LOC118201399 [Stegodyphus dumicola]